VSIIVPAYNEEHGLGGVLTQLSAIQAEMSATGQTVEIIVKGRR
jgi:glycosyltransferase involved in cell wall biosynthesis